MKGIVFNLLEEYIGKNMGMEKYEEIIVRCNLNTKRPFVGPGTYPDEDLTAIISEIVKTAGIQLPDALRSFGRFCFCKLSEKYPCFVSPYTHPKPFLKSVESIIHVEVRKLYEDAGLPAFIYFDSAPDLLAIQYISGRRLCKFMEGLIDGVADYYKSPVRYEQRRCMLAGDEICEFHLTFLPYMEKDL